MDPNEVKYDTITVKESRLSSETLAESDDDRKILESMGYKQELNRGLGAFMNFAFGFTEVSVLCSLSSVYLYGLQTGGPVVIIWGWIVTYACTMCVAYSFAEICSVYPSAGSVYHWAGMIVPEKYRAVSAYVCGWANFLGNAAGDAAFAFSWALFLSAGIAAGGGEDLTTGALVGVSIGILTVWTVLNFCNVSQVGWVNNIAAFVQVGSVVIILVGLLSRAPRLSTAEFVFTRFNNETGWSSPSYVCGIGLLTGLFGFSGYEASAHMAEETKGSRTAAPKGIINTCLLTGLAGLAYLLTLLFVTTSISDAVDGPTGSAAVNVFLLAGGSEFGQFLAWLLVVNLFFAGVSSVTVTGRITYALMRDGAFPYSDYWAEVNELTKSPVRSLMFVYLFDAALLLLPLASTVAFNSIIGIATIGFDVSYGIPILLKLIFRFNSFPQTSMSTGKYSNALNLVSVIWLFGTSVLLFLPTVSPVTPDDMNYAVVVVSFFSLASCTYWFAYAKDNFRGPVKRANDLDQDPTTEKSSTFGLEST